MYHADCFTLCIAGIIAQEEVSVPFGTSADVCAASTAYCSCFLVEVDGSNDNCGPSYPDDQLLLTVYTFSNVTEEHTVTFVFKCIDSYVPSSATKVSVKDDGLEGMYYI